MIPILCLRNVLAVVATHLLATAGVDAEPPSQSKHYTSAVRVFADTVLEHGRDNYGPNRTPLFVDGLHADGLQPVRWQGPERQWVLCNVASQQPLFRLLDGLTALGEGAKYRAAAEEAARFTLEHLRTPNGLLHWGGHAAWDLGLEQSVGQGEGLHEVKGQAPYFDLMWRVNSDATRRLMEGMWAGHVIDWSTLDYNRHANSRRPARPQWEHEYNDSTGVPFVTDGTHLSFVNVTPSLLHAGVMLTTLDGNAQALRWTRRLIQRWQEARHPRTGLSGGQLSYRKVDRAQQALGHVHPEINEARIVATYHQTSRYHYLPLAQMHAAMSLPANADGAALPSN